MRHVVGSHLALIADYVVSKAKVRNYVHVSRQRADIRQLIEKLLLCSYVFSPVIRWYVRRQVSPSSTECELLILFSMSPKAWLPRLVSDGNYKQCVIVHSVNKGERKPVIQGKAAELVTKTPAYAG